MTAQAHDTAGNARLDRFKAEIAEMRLKESDPGKEANLVRLGAVLLVLGVVVGIVAFFISHGTTNPLQQRDAIVIALTGVALSIAGAALFLRYGLTQFLRFWLARMIFEQSNRDSL
jgi:peptidoglycan/LPS O-acetylase OafA/YrhL